MVDTGKIIPSVKFCPKPWVDQKQVKMVVGGIQQFPHHVHFDGNSSWNKNLAHQTQKDVMESTHSRDTTWTASAATERLVAFYSQPYLHVSCNFPTGVYFSN